MAQFVNSSGPPGATDPPSLVFIQVSGSAGEEERRAVRSQAMRNFRKRQRGAILKLCFTHQLSRGTDMYVIDERARHELPGTSVPPPLSDAAVYRSAAAGAFMNAYFPRSLHHLGVISSHGDMWRCPRSATVEAAVDTIYLLQLDSDSHNATIKLQAQERQLASISHLRRDLEQREPDFIGAISSALFLLLSEVS